jgi:hypothetical protein
MYRHDVSQTGVWVNKCLMSDYRESAYFRPVYHLFQSDQIA